MFGIGRRNVYAQNARLIKAATREASDPLAQVKARERGTAVRVLGNLLIVVGLLMLLGIGGWYGYNWWSNEQFKQEIAQKYGPASVSAAGVTDPAQATPVVSLPVILSGTLASNMLGIANTLPTEIDNSPPVRLSIPSVGIDSEVVPISWSMIPSPNGGQKSEWQVADFAVGHHAGSVNPGQTGNVVLSGHVDYKGQVFRELHKVDRGDEVILYTEKGQYLYVVQAIHIVKEDGVPEAQKRENARFMNQTPDQTLTMITCYPYGIDDHRLIVIAKPYQSALSAQSEFQVR